jgi:ATP-dependent protease HslVU (ClpYQ) peptidase subunit
MTVIMAVKRAGQVWLGSDTRITYGNDFKVDCPIDLDSKLVKLETGIVGAAGDITMRNYLELFVSKGDNAKTPLDTKLDVIEFFINFKKFLKRHAGLGDADSNQVQNLHNTAWVIVTKDRIFELDEDGGILECQDMCVIGSGAVAARSVLDYIFTHQPKLTTETALQRAHEVTVKNNISCGGEQVRINVTELLR